MAPFINIYNAKGVADYYANEGSSVCEGLKLQ
jgi:hypothetical protein